jgi:hypothetical protein
VVLDPLVWRIRRRADAALGRHAALEFVVYMTSGRRRPVALGIVG